MRLLGRRVPIVADRRMCSADRRRILVALLDAARKLNAEKLAPDDVRYLRALTRFEFGAGRSGQHRGAFTMGLADVKAGGDTHYWSSALVHDGVHAWLQARARPFRDEVAPCVAQLAYLGRTGGPPHLIAHIEAFRDSRARQRARLHQP